MLLVVKPEQEWMPNFWHRFCSANTLQTANFVGTCSHDKLKCSVWSYALLFYYISLLLKKKLQASSKRDQKLNLVIKFRCTVYKIASGRPGKINGTKRSTTPICKPTWLIFNGCPNLTKIYKPALSMPKRLVDITLKTDLKG